MQDENEAAMAHLATLRVQTQLKDPTFELNGKTFIAPGAAEWHDIQCHVESIDCQHLDTMCPRCVDSWMADHYVRLVSPDGSTLSINQVPEMLDITELHEGH